MFKPVITNSFLVLLTIAQMFGQEQLGIRLDNYAGINSTLLNPAGHLHSPYQWDVNLGEIAHFTSNNYLFFANSSILSLIGNDEPYVYGPNNRLRDQPVDGLVLDFQDDDANRFGISSTSIMGPSFSIRINPQHSVGLITRVRAAASVTGVPNELSFYTFNSDVGRKGFILDQASANLMTWSEIGINYLFQKETANGRLGIGINLKSLSGYESAFVFNETPLEIAKVGTDSVQSSIGRVEYGYTTSLLELTEDDYSVQKNGSGIGIDLGVTYSFGEAEGADYRWKLGVSILDLGVLNFNENAELHITETDRTTVFGGTEYADFDELSKYDDALRYFSFQVLGDSLASRAGTEYSVGLPTAISFQADYNIKPGIFLNATIVQGTPLTKNGIDRTNLIALTPRYESRWLNIATPISLYNFNQLRMGLAMKLGIFYLGSEDLLSYVRRSNLSGIDFYLGLKLVPFGKNSGQNGGRNGRQKDQGVRCYRF